MSATPGRVRGLRGNAIAAVVMLLIEYCLGISANLYSTLPAGDHGKSLLGAFGAAVGDGPVLVTIHALIGTLLLITASAAVIRSVRLGARPPIAITSVGLLAILIAWISGSEFVGHDSSGSSLAMALATAAAILCYLIVILAVPAVAPPRGASEDLQS